MRGGKTAHTIARSVDKLLQPQLDSFVSPLEYILFNYRHNSYELARKLCEVGIGCFRQRSRILLELAARVVENGLNLKTCSPQDLEQIKGIGPKTSRFFILHSRAAQQCAVLDRHILTYLRKQGISAPHTTPPKGSPKYSELENKFIGLAKAQNKTVAELDLEVWNNFARKSNC